MRYYTPHKIKQIRRHLKAGGIIAYPTESCFGFGCDPFNYTALNKLIRIKGRTKTKGLIVIAGAFKQLAQLIQPLSGAEQAELSQYWPGFNSLILPVTAKVPRNLIGRHQKIAVRISQHRLVKQLCHELNSPLVSTSANRAGHQSIRNYRECVRQFGRTVLVLPGLTNFARRPSTIIDWQSRRVLRK